MSKVKVNLQQIWLDYQAKTGRQMTKTETAKALGTSRSTFDNWLAGNVGRKLDLDLASRVCDFFNVPLLALIEYTPLGNHAEG